MGEHRTDREIVRGLQQGHSDAWTSLCEIHSERLWCYVARLIGRDEAAVADVFQDTMLAVARTGRSLKDDTRVWAWLASIAHRRVALYWRTRYRNDERLRHDAESLAVMDDPSSATEQREQSQDVRRLLAEMSPQDANVLVSKYLDGMSVQEIVQLHGGTIESVRSRLARARREFRERFHRASLK